MFLIPNVKQTDSWCPSFCQDRALWGNPCFPDHIPIPLFSSENNISWLSLRLTVYYEAEWHYGRVYMREGGQLIPQDHLMNLFHRGSYPDAPSTAQALPGKRLRTWGDLWGFFCCCSFLGVPVAPHGNQSRSDLCSLRACQNWKIF